MRTVIHKVELVIELDCEDSEPSLSKIESALAYSTADEALSEALECNAQIRLDVGSIKMQPGDARLMERLLRRQGGSSWGGQWRLR